MHITLRRSQKRTILRLYTCWDSNLFKINIHFNKLLINTKFRKVVIFKICCLALFFALSK